MDVWTIDEVMRDEVSEDGGGRLFFLDLTGEEQPREWRGTLLLRLRGKKGECPVLFARQRPCPVSYIARTRQDRDRVASISQHALVFIAFCKVARASRDSPLLQTPATRRMDLRLRCICSFVPECVSRMYT